MQIAENTKFYKFKSPGLDKYIMSLEGTVVNVVTKEIVAYDKHVPNVIYLEVEGKVTPFTGQMLLDDLDRQAYFSASHKTERKVHYYIVKDMQGNTGDIIRSKDAMSRLFPEIDLEQLDSFLVAGYTYNFGDRYLIFSGDLKTKPTVSFSIGWEDKVLIVDESAKRVRHVTGEQLGKADPRIQIDDKIVFIPPKQDEESGKTSYNLGVNQHPLSSMLNQNPFRDPIEKLKDQFCGTQLPTEAELFTQAKEKATEHIVDQSTEQTQLEAQQKIQEIKCQTGQKKRDEFFQARIQSLDGSTIKI